MRVSSGSRLGYRTRVLASPLTRLPTYPLPRLYSAMPRLTKRSRAATDALLEILVAQIDQREGDQLPADTVPTGFGSLDRILAGGLRRKDLVVLAGDVGSGKSALALAIAVRAAIAQIPTMFFSGEMSADRVLERALALEGRTAIDDMRQGRLDEAARASVGAAAVRLRHSSLVVRPLLGNTFDEISAALDIVPRRQLLVVDSLQLTAPPRQAARLQERNALAVRALKSLAVERDIAVLVIAQLPHHRGDRPDPRPVLDDLGALGAIKQNADVILMIYREEMYRPGQGVEGATELIVAKNRNGPTGFVDLYFYPQWMRFVDMLDAD
jgi:replicative DNA helicase